MKARAPFSSDAEIEAIGQGMVSGSWPKSHWTHDCHWAAALWVISDRGLIRAQADMPGLIRRYNEAVGGRNTDTEGYHETITQASLLAAAQARTEAPGAALHTVCNTICAGPLGRSDWILTYWSRERLFTPAARHAWLAPDRAALPFDAPLPAGCA
ncbi:MAG: hypothetical protein R3D85_08490 [Paracoccaceae bacterium]